MIGQQQKSNQATGSYVGSTAAAEKESLRHSQMSQRSSASQRGKKHQQSRDEKPMIRGPESGAHPGHGGDIR